MPPTSISRRSAMAAVLPIVAMPGLASATPAPADPALSAYRAVMARKDEGDAWEDVEAWCDAEGEALTALAEPSPGDITALLNRVIVLAERMDGDTSWNMMAPEEDLLRSIAKQARALLASAGDAA